MLRVVILDDEVHICHLIKSMIDWESMGLQVVAVSSNSHETLEEMVRTAPDIVITDIKMPGMDGLHMIDRARECCPHTKFILISGFDDFQYAKTAIHYGVEDYLLKPVDQYELEKALRKTILKITSQKAQMDREKRQIVEMQQAYAKLRQSFVLSLANAAGEKLDLDVDIVNREFHFSFQEGIFQFVSCVIDQERNVPLEQVEGAVMAALQLLKSRFNEICIDTEGVVNRNMAFFLLHYHPDHMKTADTLFRCLSFSHPLVHMTLGVGTPCHSLKELLTAVASSQDVLPARLVLGTGQSLFAEKVLHTKADLKDVQVELRNPECTTAAAMMDFDTLLYLIENFLQDSYPRVIAAHPSLSLLFLKNTFQAVLSLLGECHDLNEELDSQAQQTLAMLDTFYRYDSARDFLLDALNAVFSEIQKKKGNIPKKIALAKEFIDTHYREHIELEDIAKVVYLSPGYFSALFRQELGISFRDYLIQVRMDKAKEMLRDLQYNISEIADYLGYKEARYFSKFFKKYTGVKPSNYRKIYHK